MPSYDHAVAFDYNARWYIWKVALILGETLLLGCLLHLLSFSHMDKDPAEASRSACYWNHSLGYLGRAQQPSLLCKGQSSFECHCIILHTRNCCSGCFPALLEDCLYGSMQGHAEMPELTELPYVPQTSVPLLVLLDGCLVSMPNYGFSSLVWQSHPCVLFVPWYYVKIYALLNYFYCCKFPSFFMLYNLSFSLSPFSFLLTSLLSRCLAKLCIFNSFHLSS